MASMMKQISESRNSDSISRIFASGDAGMCRDQGEHQVAELVFGWKVDFNGQFLKPLMSASRLSLL
jgi:hypothetical protein